MSYVEDLLDKHNIFYRVSGNDVLIKCLNPEHDDRNPSMRIDRILGIFNCFSCGYKGNLFKHYDVEVSVPGMKAEKLKRKLNEIRATGVGLQMPEGWVPFTKEYRGISASTYAKFDAFQHFDSNFSGRINFPIKDGSGRIIAFQGRDESGTLPNKYMFTPKSIKLPLYPLVAPLQGKVILVEGMFDMLNLHDKGLTNAICCFGVNNFSNAKLNLLKISGVTGIDVLFDSDEPGEKAAEKIKKMAGEFPVRIVKLKSGDPGDMSLLQVSKLKNKLYNS